MRVHDGALVALPVALEHDFVVADRQPSRREHELHRRLVHADGGREHAGADVRHVRELEQSLHGAVLAVRAVQHREHHVEREARDDDAAASGLRSIVISVSPPGCATTCASRAASAGSLPRAWMTSAADVSDGGRSGSVQRPSFSMRIGDGFVACGVEVGEHRGGGGERDLVFAGSAAVDHADAKLFHADHGS